MSVKISLLSLLEKGPRRYSNVVKKLKKPDKTVYVTLKALGASKLVTKDEEGRYAITDAGRMEAKRIRLVMTLEHEDDPEIISRLAELHLALTKGSLRLCREKPILAGTQGM